MAGLSGPAPAAPAIPSELRRSLPRRLAVIAVVTAILAATGWAINNNAAEFSAAFAQLHQLTLGWLLAAVALEIACYTAYAVGQRRLLAACGYRVGTAVLTGISAAAQALGNVIPIGSAAAGIYVVRQLRRRGVEEFVGVAVQGMTMVAYFGALGVLALIGAQIAGSEGPVDLRWTAGVVVIATLAVLGLTRVGIRHRWGLGLIARMQARWPSWPWPDAAASARVGYPTGRGWVVVGTVMGLSWLVDCGCLVCCAFAVAASVPWAGLLVAYCAGQLAAIIPFAPGGLGVVEGSLTLALVAYGGTGQSTLAAVLLYRLVSYWSLLPVGAGAHLVLRRLGRVTP